MATIDDVVENDKPIGEARIKRTFRDSPEDTQYGLFTDEVSELANSMGGNVAKVKNLEINDSWFGTKYSATVEVYRKKEDPYLPSVLKNKGILPASSAKIKVRKGKYDSEEDAKEALYNKASKYLGEGNMIFLDEVETKRSIFGDKLQTTARMYSLPKDLDLTE